MQFARNMQVRLVKINTSARSPMTREAAIKGRNLLWFFSPIFRLVFQLTFHIQHSKSISIMSELYVFHGITSWDNVKINFLFMKNFETVYN